MDNIDLEAMCYWTKAPVSGMGYPLGIAGQEGLRSIVKLFKYAIALSCLPYQDKKPYCWRYHIAWQQYTENHAGTELETSFLLASFYSSRNCHTGRWKRKVSKGFFQALNPANDNTNFQGKLELLVQQWYSYYEGHQCFLLGFRFDLLEGAHSQYRGPELRSTTRQS